MKCFKCGTQLKENGKFCPKCGAQQGFSDELIEKAKNGDQDAIAELYNRTYNSVYFTVKAMVKEEDAVLDIVQDSYVKGFRSLEQLKEADKFRAWMKTIAHNRAVDYFRKNKPVIFSQMSTDSDEAVEFEDDRPENLPEVVVDQKETTRLIKEILDSLSDEQRLVVGMFYYEQLSVREIAETLGVSENTVKSRLAYGRKKIEFQVKELEKRGTKLYSLAPLPFFLAILGNLETQAAAPDVKMLGRICQSCGEVLQVAGQTGAAGMTGASGAAGVSGAAGAAAGKGLIVKVIAGVAATALIGGGVTGGLLWREHKKAETTQQQEMKNEVTEAGQEGGENNSTTSVKPERKEPTKEEIFLPVIDEYKAAIRQTENSGEMPMYNESLPNVNSPMARWHYNARISGVADTHDSGLYYSYYDIDKNGVDEFLIGYGNVGMVKNVGDVYTIKDGKPNKLFDIQNDDTFLYVYTDGTMGAEVFNGDSTDRFIYRLTEDGTDIEETPADSESGEKVVAEDMQWELLDGYDQPVTDTGDAASIYNSLAEEYKKSLEATEYDREKFPNVNSVVWYAQTQKGAETKCAYYDINDDGMPEFLVGYGNGEKKTVAAIYGAGYKKPVKLLEVPNEYAGLSIYPDGKIKAEYYDGGKLSQIEIYELSEDGSEAELISEMDETAGQKQITDFQWMDY